MSPIQVVHVNSTDIRGGAARAAYRLHSAGEVAGFASQMFVRKCTSNHPSVSVLRPSNTLLGRLSRKLRRMRIKKEFAEYQAVGGIDYDLFTDDRSIYTSEVLEQLPTCNIINLHWISSFIDYTSFFPAVARRQIPIVWTLHDMNPFTGGCHYDRGCGRFVEGCGACPQLKSSDQHDLSRQIFLRKQAAFSQLSSDMLHLVTPSRWLAKEAQRSTLFKRFPVSVIPNGLDTSVFAPRDCRIAREVFQIPQDLLVLLFVAGSLKDVRKGLAFLKQAIAHLYNAKRLLLVSVGKTEWATEMNIPYHTLGTIEDDRLLSLAYSTADLFVIPSLQDNLPNTVVEALACGTPVVGFGVGGIPDMVRPGITGVLTPPGEAAALGAAITDLLHQPEQLAQMSANCRRIAVEEYDMAVQGRRYRELYDALCSR